MGLQTQPSGRRLQSGLCGAGTICGVPLVHCISTAPSPFRLDQYGLVRSSIYLLGSEQSCCAKPPHPFKLP